MFTETLTVVIQHRDRDDSFILTTKIDALLPCVDSCTIAAKMLP